MIPTFRITAREVGLSRLIMKSDSLEKLQVGWFVCLFGF